jgi:RNA polymerase sigma-70 factor (ECF subfamily)
MSALPLRKPVEVPPVAAEAPGSGGRPDFSVIFEQYAPYVLRVLPRLGVRPSDVEDVAQDVFLVVHRRLAQFEGRSSVKTWVYGICIRVAFNYRDRAHRRHERLVAETTEPVDSRTPARDLAGQRALQALDQALCELSQAQRSVFVLHAIEDLSILEVAAALGCSKFTVYARWYAAQAHIRKVMGQRPWQEEGT